MAKSDKQTEIVFAFARLSKGGNFVFVDTSDAKGLRCMYVTPEQLAGSLGISADAAKRAKSPDLEVRAGIVDGCTLSATLRFASKAAGA
jgi:hypothetical protein